MRLMGASFKKIAEKLAAGSYAVETKRRFIRPIPPGFFIGAHAAVEKYQLMTRDKGRLSTYFPSVKLIIPHN